MSSPFNLFRRHQRLAMVIITGMAMISFVAFGMIDSFRSVPAPLLAVFLAAVVGCGMWVAGLTNGKSSEWGVMGAILGGLLGVLIAVRTQEAPAAQIAGGNLSQEAYYEMQLQRNMANQFMFQAMAKTQQGGFRGFQLLPDARRDLVFSELLIREADRLQIAVPDTAVTDFISQMTNKKMTKEIFEEVRKDMRTNDKKLLDALRRELRAQQAFKLLYPMDMLYGGVVPPAMQYDYFKKLNVRQTAEIVAVPVKEFTAGLPEPTTGELAELFSQYRGNFPNMDESGFPVEGQPGFRQPARVKVAYLEASFDEIKGLVGEVTDEEIQAQYEKQYAKPLPPSMQPGSDGPALPGVTPPVVEPPASETPATPESATPPAEPAPGTPETPANTPAETGEPAPEAIPETPATETPAPEGTTEPAPPADESTSAVSRRKLSQVAFYQEESASQEESSNDDASASETPAAETAATETPAAEVAPATGDKPAAEGDKPDEATTPATPPTGGVPAAGDSAEVPPPPTSEVRPLDDELKEEIREDIIRERAFLKSRELMQAARTYMEEQGYRHTANSPDSEDYLTEEQLADNLKKYAAENHLVYVETSFLSPQELMTSEDYPVGRAYSFEGQPMTVAGAMNQSSPEELYTVISAQDFQTLSEYVLWKIDHKAAGIPESMDDEIVKKQVIEAWKLRQALPKAEARAQELANKMKNAEGDLAAALSEETITGTKDSFYVALKETGSFTWMQRPQTPGSMDPRQQQPVRPTTIAGAEDAGERFRKAVFEEMQVGEIRVVPNNEDTVVYVVKLNSRAPESTAEGEAQLRKLFLASGSLSEYIQLGQADVFEMESNADKWTEDLWERYDVVLPETLSAVDGEE